MKRLSLAMSALILLWVFCGMPALAAHGQDDWHLCEQATQPSSFETTKLPARSILTDSELFAQTNGQDTSNTQEASDDQLLDIAGGKHTEVAAKPMKVQWLALLKGETVSELAYRYCKARNNKTVGMILLINGLTWESAKKLPVGYKFYIPNDMLAENYQNPLRKLNSSQQEIAGLTVKVKKLQNEIEKVRTELAETKIESSKLNGRAIKAENDLDAFRNKIVEIVNKEFSAMKVEPSRSLEEIASFLQIRFASLKVEAQELQDSLEWNKLLGWLAVFIIVLLIVLIFLIAKKLFRAIRENTKLRAITRLARVKFHVNHEGKTRTFAFYCTMDNDNRFNISPLNWSGTSIVLSPKETKKAMRFYLNRYLTDTNVVEVKERIDKLFASGRLVELDPLSDSFMEEAQDEM